MVKPQKQQPQKPLVNAFDLMTPEELAIVEARIARLDAEQDAKISREWFAIAEFGVYFGWSGVQDVIADVITIEQMKLLLDGARKVHSQHVIDQCNVAVASQSKQKDFTKIMQPYYDDVKGVN